MERAQYRLLGAQYKVPRLVREEIEASHEFRASARELAEALGRDPAEVWSEVQACLDEMVTGYSRFLLDIMARAGQMMLRPTYGDEIDYDQAQVERVREEMRRHAAVILPSHKSNFDGMVVPILMHENGLPPVHTFAGINMAFWPLGAVMRRAGRIFIRRDIKDDPVYRWVLRQYLGYLVEKRFTLEWYIEGTRSRSGKLGATEDGAARIHRRRGPRGARRRRRDGARLDHVRPAPRGRRVCRRGARCAEAVGVAGVDGAVRPAAAAPSRRPDLRALRRAALAAGRRAPGRLTGRGEPRAAEVGLRGRHADQRGDADHRDRARLHGAARNGRPRAHGSGAPPRARPVARADPFAPAAARRVRREARHRRRRRVGARLRLPPTTPSNGTTAVPSPSTRSRPASTTRPRSIATRSSITSSKVRSASSRSSTRRSATTSDSTRSGPRHTGCATCSSSTSSSRSAKRSARRSRPSSMSVCRHGRTSSSKACTPMCCSSSCSRCMRPACCDPSSRRT